MKMGFPRECRSFGARRSLVKSRYFIVIPKRRRFLEWEYQDAIARLGMHILDERD